MLERLHFASCTVAQSKRYLATWTLQGVLQCMFCSNVMLELSAIGRMLQNELQGQQAKRHDLQTTC